MKASEEGIRLFVYALCEPDSGEVRYIGLSGNLWKRLLAHYRHSGIRPVKEWIESLRARNLIPSLKVLAEVRGIEVGLEAEEKEIKRHFHQPNSRLLNERGTEQSSRKNKPTRRRIEFHGRSLTLAQWASELGISRQALNIRLLNHPAEIALSRPRTTADGLNGRHIKKMDFGSETIDVDCPMPVGLTYAERRKRRCEMARLAAGGTLVHEIANRFGVTTATVNLAIREFTPILKTA